MRTVEQTITKLIEQSVRNKSFADIGPLWETVNEKISVAHQFGACSLTAIDQFPANDPLWAAFNERMQTKKIQPRCISGNVMDYSGPAFDITHCGFVIYHAPDPLLFLKKLRAITKERLILTSLVITGSIVNDAGELSVSKDGLVFVPAISSKNKAIVRRHWSEFLGERPSGAPCR